MPLGIPSTKMPKCQIFLDWQLAPSGLCLGRYDLFSYDHIFISIGIYQGESPTSCQRVSQIPNPRFPEMSNLMTRRLLRSGGSDLSRGFHHGKSRTLITRTSEFAIPDFTKWEISRHMASVNRTVHIYPGVFTMENPELSSPGLPSSRFSISRDGKSHDTWPPSIGRFRSISGFSPWKIPNSRHQ
jgi:hypothetical protein